MSEIYEIYELDLMSVVGVINTNGDSDHDWAVRLNNNNMTAIMYRNHTAAGEYWADECCLCSSYGWEADPGLTGSARDVYSAIQFLVERLPEWNDKLKNLGVSLRIPAFTDAGGNAK